MNVSLADLHADHTPLKAELLAAMTRVVDSGHFIGGPEVEGFEKELAEFEGVARAVGVSSGTDALLVLLMALGIGPGDEIITTPFTFFSTAGGIVRIGAKPVFVDIDPVTLNLDPALVADKMTRRTRAVLAVNLYGRRATLPQVGVPVLEDSAQSVGSGPLRGFAAAMSFFPTKNLGAMGDGGAVLTNDHALADKIALMRTHGSKPKYVHHIVGGNFRLDAMQAAILRVKLQHLTQWTQARRRNASHYMELFAQAGVTQLQLPYPSPEHVYHHFIVRCEKREALRAHLQKNGVATEVYYPMPMHLQPCFVDFGYRAGDLPHSERAASEVLALPIHPSVTQKMQEYVVDKVREFFA